MASSGWFYYHFESEYFSPVWFAPADETGVPPDELRQDPGPGGGDSERKPEKQKKKIHRNRQERDIIEMLTIITAAGVLNV